MGVRERVVIFRCGSDSLVGIVHEPVDVRSDVGVLVIVGGPQYRAGSHRQFTLMARAMAASGVAVMRFDYRGMGDSEGEMRTFESVDADIRAAIEAMLEAIPALRGIALWGLCDGASAALMYGWRDERVRALVLVNPWARTQSGQARSYVRHYYLERFLQREFWTKLLVGRLNLVSAARGFLANIARASGRHTAGQQTHLFLDRMRQGMTRFDHPILLLLSERDLTAREFLDLCATSKTWRASLERANSRIVHLKGADHTFSRRSNLEEATLQCGQFLETLGGTSGVHR